MPRIRCALVAWTMALLGAPQLGALQARSGADDPARITVSLEEVRVVFQPHPELELDTTGRTDCEGERSNRALYHWGVHVAEAAVGPRILAARLWTCRAFDSWQALAASAVAGIHRPGIALVREPTPVEVTAAGDSIVIVLRDREAILGLFGFRPEAVRSRIVRSGDAAVEWAGDVPVQYVEPRIPEPDSAFLARSTLLRREYEASRRRITRRILVEDPGSNPSAPLWIELGDSVQVYVGERICQVDVCYTDELAVAESAWSVDRSGVASIRFHDLPRDFVALALSPAHLHGEALGRGVVSASGLESPRDTLPVREPPPGAIRRDVLVTRPVGSLVIRPRIESAQVGDSVRLEVRVIDDRGALIEGAPVQVLTSSGRSGTRRIGTEPVTIRYDRPGEWQHVVSRGELADTLRVTVGDAGRR